MPDLVEFKGPVPIIVEVAEDNAGGVGFRPASGAVGAITSKVGASLEESLKMNGAVGNSVRAALAGTKIEEAEIKIGLKMSGSGQFIIAQSTVEGSFEVTFKVKAAP